MQAFAVINASLTFLAGRGEVISVRMKAWRGTCLDGQLCMASDCVDLFRLTWNMTLVYCFVLRTENKIKITPRNKALSKGAASAQTSSQVMT